MESKKIINSLNETTNQLSEFRTGNWVEMMNHDERVT